MSLADILKKNDKRAKRKNTAKVAAGIGLGAIAGAVAGTLLAPKSGKETRDDIVKGTMDTFEKAKSTVNEAKEKISRNIEERKDIFGDSADQSAASEDLKESEETEAGEESEANEEE